ncbi:hypothetical protein Droror1_Dr00008777, partial [Drosera rotundifolia]
LVLEVRMSEMDVSEKDFVETEKKDDREKEETKDDHAIDKENDCVEESVEKNDEID